MGAQAAELLLELRGQLVPRKFRKILQVLPGRGRQEERVHLQVAVEPRQEVHVFALRIRGVVHLREVGPQPRGGAITGAVLRRQLLHEVLDHPRQRGEAPHAEELWRLDARGLRCAASAEELRAAREHLEEAHGLLVYDLHRVVHEVRTEKRGHGENLCVVALRHAGAEEALGVQEPDLRAVGRTHVRAAEPHAHGLGRGPSAYAEDLRVSYEGVEEEALPGVVGAHNRYD
mmetsp:Transcript_17865/g.56298  ORF Transcript_17865/g.56298 Transcript_17865/m.56298 type:complete len:231 (-) Transcript_17865:312-1004(-)